MAGPERIVMTHAGAIVPRRSLGATMRPDAWWAKPALVFFGLSAFLLYSTWAAFQGKYYYWGPYLSPFTRRNFMDHRRTVCLGRSRAGGPAGCGSRPRC